MEWRDSRAKQGRMERITRLEDGLTDPLARSRFTQLVQLDVIARDHRLAIVVDHRDLQGPSTARLHQLRSLFRSARKRRHLARGPKRLECDASLADDLEASLEGVRTSDRQGSEFTETMPEHEIGPDTGIQEHVRDQ